jgi:hypothetical protein
MLNSDIDRMNIGRVFIRCSMKPVTGITTAMVSRNAVVSHCAALAGTLKLPIRRGIATPMIVSLRITTNAEISRRLMTSLLRVATFVASASDVAAPAGFSAVVAASEFMFLRDSFQKWMPAYPK